MGKCLHTNIQCGLEAVYHAYLACSPNSSQVTLIDIRPSSAFNPFPSNTLMEDDPELYLAKKKKDGNGNSTHQDSLTTSIQSPLPFFVSPMMLFVVRARMRPAQTANIRTVALLKQRTVIADQRSARAELSIAAYLDPWHVWEVVRMVEEGVLVLRNMDGSGWP
jgi:hypothetical protein